MTIITPAPGDARRCWNLLNALDHETEYMLYEPGERTPDTSRLEALLEDANSHPENTLFLAAEDNGELIAFLSASRGPHLRTAHTAYIVCGVRKQYHRQGIASVVAWAGKDHDVEVLVPSADNGFRQGMGCPLHQVDGINRFMNNGVLIQFFQLWASQNFHVKRAI